MASDGPKPAIRAKSAAKSGEKPPAVAVPAGLPVQQTLDAKAPKPAALKPPLARAPLAAPVLPDTNAAQMAEPKSIIPAAAMPDIAAPAVSAPAVSAPQTPAPAPAPEVSPVAILHKEQNTMEATIQDSTAKTQAFFGEANTHAKTALEKGAKAFEDMNAFSKGNIEAVVESSKIAAKGFETLGQEAAEYSRKQFEGATAILKSFGSVKSPTELFKLQSDYFRQSFDSMVAESSKNTEAMLKLVGEIAQPLSNRVALAADKAKMPA